MLTTLFSIKSQKGVTMIEYALIAALVAVAAIATLGLLGGNLDAIFDYIKDQLVVPAGDPYVLI
jgi:pilus assembly protein Flp/PilA